MVTTQQLANKLNDAMNTIAASMNLNHTFKLMAHLGKAQEGNIIHGILKPVQTNVKSKGGTGAGINSVHSMYVAEFVTPSAIDNYYATVIEQVINALVVAEDGNSFTIGSDTVVWEIECGMPKEYAVRDGVGSSIPMAFTVSVTYTDNALLNGVKVWTLDGNSIPYEAEAVVLNKEGRIIPIYEYKNQQGIMLGQNKQYKFRIPYDKNDVVCTTLQSDILNGDFRKRYTLAYDDGVIQFSTTVSIYQTGDMGTQKTEDPTDIVVSFIDVGKNSFDIGNNTTIEYSIALIDWDFDNTSENTLYFASQAAQQAYISDGSSLATSIVNDHTKSTLYMPFYAPNLGTQLNTHVDVDCTWAYDVNSAANHNYAVVRKRKIVTVNNVATTTTQYFYYWVINPVFGANGMLSMDLQMDTVQTYMFDSNLTIPDCMIERAHLNRWVDNNDGTVSFDGTPSSKLFAAENITNTSKVMHRRKLLTPFVEKIKFLDRYGISDWLKDNVFGWKYIFLSPYNDPTSQTDVVTKLKIYNNTSGGGLHEQSFANQEVDYYSYGGNKIKGGMVCVCVPIYKADKKIMLVSEAATGTLEDKYITNYTQGSALAIAEAGLTALESNNYGTSLFSVVKFSTIPPIGLSTYSLFDPSNPVENDYTYYINAAGDLVIARASASTSTIYWGSRWLHGLSTDGATGVILVENSREEMYLEEYYSNYCNTFGKTANLVQNQTFSINLLQDPTYPLTHNFEGSWENKFDSYKLTFYIYNTQMTTVIDTKVYNITNWHNNTQITENIGWVVDGSVANISFKLNISYDNAEFILTGFNYPINITPGKIDIHLTKTSTPIVGDNKKTRYNPKLYSNDYYALRLTTDHGGYFDYDVQKLNDPTIKISVTEPIVPDITRTYMRITNLSEGVYNEQCDQNLTGLVDSVDTSMPLNTNTYQQMLAENKNYFLQRNLDIGLQAFGALRTGIGGAAAGAAAGSIVPGVGTAVGAVVGGIGGALSGIVGGASSIANTLINEDTEKQKSALVKNANGNVFLNIAYNEPGKYVEEYSILDEDKAKINNYMFVYGYSYGQLDSPLNYLHTRKYFNYIKAQIGDIQGVPLTNEIRNDIKQRFANGVRFWNATTFATNGVQYDLENYELWLEN